MARTHQPDSTQNERGKDGAFHFGADSLRNAICRGNSRTHNRFRNRLGLRFKDDLRESRRLLPRCGTITVHFRGVEPCSILAALNWAASVICPAIKCRDAVSRCRSIASKVYRTGFSPQGSRRREFETQRDIACGTSLGACNPLIAARRPRSLASCLDRYGAAINC